MNKRALILAGDHWHDPAICFECLGQDLAAEGIEAENTTDTDQFGRYLLRDKQLFVLHRDGYEFPKGMDQPPVPWMRPFQEEVIENFILRGGGFLAFHNAGWGYPWQGAYRRVLGGYYIGHPPTAPFHVSVVNPDHPVTKGVKAYTITDEQHWLWFDYDRVTLLLVSQGQDGRQSAAGWAYGYGLGRVVFLANGHTLEAHRHPEFTLLKRNAIRWLLRIGEKITPADLTTSNS